MQSLQNSVWTLVSGWCRHHRHHRHQLPATFYTTPSLCCTYHTLLSGLSSSKSEGSLKCCDDHPGVLSPGIWTHPVFWCRVIMNLLLSLNTTPGCICRRCFTVSCPGIDVHAVFHCQVSSKYSNVRHTYKWLWHLNSDAGIINIHIKSFPGQFLAYILFSPYFLIIQK